MVDIMVTAFERDASCDADAPEASVNARDSARDGRGVENSYSLSTLLKMGH